MTRIEMKTIIRSVVVLTFLIGCITVPVSGSGFNSYYYLSGNVIIANDDLHLPLEGESVIVPETPYTLHLYLTDTFTNYAYPWKGYQPGWKHTSVTVTEGGGALFPIHETLLENDPDYWYIHLDPPEGYIPVSANPLTQYGKVIDSATIHYNDNELPEGLHTFLFQVKRDPKCLDPVFTVYAPTYGDAPPQDVYFKASDLNKCNCGVVQEETYLWKEYEWDFGDPGAPVKGKEVKHTYKNTGTYKVTLTVVDTSGIKRTSHQFITILERGLKAVDSSPVSNKNEPLGTILPNAGQLEAETIHVHDISKWPCEQESGGNELTRGGGLCVDILTDPGNCGSCNNNCFPPLNCVNGKCTGESSGLNIGDIIGSIITLPQGLMSFIRLSPAENPQPIANTRFDEVVVLENPADETHGDSMQIVMMSKGDSDNSEIAPARAGTGPKVVVGDIALPAAEDYFIETPDTTPTPAPQTEWIANIPTTGIASQPEVISPITRSCPAGQIRCGGICSDPMTDASHCGSCTSACPSGYNCVAGICSQSCGSGLTSCNGACVSLLSDTNNCGACGNVCMNGASCTSGSCVAQMVTTQPTRLGGVGTTHL